MSTTKRRAKVTYIDPAVMFAPGECLYDDGVYRRRNGLPDRPETLTPDEVAALDPATLTPYLTDADRAMQPGHFNRSVGQRFLAPQEG